MENPHKDALDLKWFKWNMKYHKWEFWLMILFFLNISIWVGIGTPIAGIIMSIVLIPTWVIRSILLYKTNVDIAKKWQIAYDHNTNK